MYTLIVIDMQPGFRAAARERTLRNCSEEIQKAILTGAHIIFLEFAGHGNTNNELAELVDGYQHQRTIFKGQDDGSKEIQQAVEQHGFMIGRFRIVGVNTDYCVLATVEGLRKRFPSSKIEVVCKACSSVHSHANGIKLIRKIENVAVV